ncbi:MAG TPA: lysophospholipid acyltransferase family protein [Candidatus Binatia bacterium]|nr:lysophospholipid acyltransferase family protein [Candidatus Binatia bacterium]
MLYGILKPLAVLVMRLWFRLEVRGTEHVPAAGPVLLVANHSSLLDPPLVGGAAPRRLCFMAKAELFRVPLFGRLIRALNARPVRREGAGAQALREALDALRSGQALLVFPEGTRGDEGDIRPAKPGAGMLAVMSGATVVPVYVSGSGRALPRGRLVPRPAKVVVRFGPALSFTVAPDDARRERYREAAEEMMRAVARLRDAAVRAPGAAATPAHMQDRISG